MEISSPSLLRWFLFAIGVVVVCWVYWVSSRKSSSRPPTSKISPELHLDTVQENTNDEILSTNQRVEGHAESDIPEDVLEKTSEKNIFGSNQDDSDSDSKVLVLHVQATSQTKFSGVDIVHVAKDIALERTSVSGSGFFERHILSDVLSPDSNPLFYVTNMFSPGVFDWDQMDYFSTSGLSLFAELSGALTPLETFDEMLKCARLFAAKLQGTVLDESRSHLTDQTIWYIKENLQAYTSGRATSSVNN